MPRRNRRTGRRLGLPAPGFFVLAQNAADVALAQFADAGALVAVAGICEGGFGMAHFNQYFLDRVMDLVDG